MKEMLSDARRKACSGPENLGHFEVAARQLKRYQKQLTSTFCPPAGRKSLVGDFPKPSSPALSSKPALIPLIIVVTHVTVACTQKQYCCWCVSRRSGRWQYTGRDAKSASPQECRCFLAVISPVFLPLGLTHILVQWEPCHSDYITPNIHCCPFPAITAFQQLQSASESSSKTTEDHSSLKVHQCFIKSQGFEKNSLLVLRIGSIWWGRNGTS